MARIKLIVTGDMEKLVLHESLRRFFPNVRNGEEVIWDKPRYTQGVTSSRLQPLLPDHPPSKPMLELAKAMIAETVDGKTGKPADLVVAIDDVELGNLDQEEVIAVHLQAAINTVIAARGHDANTEARYRTILRGKCSFHLLKPMVESYLFGDDNALRVAGVPAGVSPKLIHPSDVEQFETNDSAWLSTCHLENGRRQQEKPWWRHERHPKHYIGYLTAQGQAFYEETRHGKKALASLDWLHVPKESTDIPVLRSLFEDLADWFGVQNPILGSTHPAFYPVRQVNRSTLLLRNL